MYNDATGEFHHAAYNDVIAEYTIPETEVGHRL